MTPLQATHLDNRHSALAKGAIPAAGHLPESGIPRHTGGASWPGNTAGWTRGEPSGDYREFRRMMDAAGSKGLRRMIERLTEQVRWYVLDVPGGATVWPLEPSWTNPEYQGFGRPRKPKLRDGQRRTMEQRSDELPEEAWREITVAEGSQGPRTYRFSAQRVRVTKRRKPGEVVWAIWRCNLDGSEPRYYLSNAPEGTPLETLAYVGGSRWRIETEFETEKGDVGLDEYETRSWAGWDRPTAQDIAAYAKTVPPPTRG